MFLTDLRVFGIFREGPLPLSEQIKSVTLDLSFSDREPLKSAFEYIKKILSRIFRKKYFLSQTVRMLCQSHEADLTYKHEVDHTWWHRDDHFATNQFKQRSNFNES